MFDDFFLQKQGPHKSWCGTWTIVWQMVLRSCRRISCMALRGLQRYPKNLWVGHVCYVIQSEEKRNDQLDWQVFLGPILTFKNLQPKKTHQRRRFFCPGHLLTWNSATGDLICVICLNPRGLEQHQIWQEVSPYIEGAPIQMPVVDAVGAWCSLVLRSMGLND